MAAARVERRLAAILAADVVGYSRLMEADEAGTFARLKALRAGADRADPARSTAAASSTSRATAPSSSSAASSTRSRPRSRSSGRCRRARPDLPEDRRIRYRIGINLGDVIVDGDDHLRRRRQRRGADRGLVRARRGLGLAQRPRPGQGQARPAASQPPALHRVKNISEPVETFRVALDGRRRRGAGHRRGDRGRWRWRCRGRACSRWSLARRGLVALAGRAGGGASPRSRCCRSTISAATRRPAGSPTGSPRTSSPTSPASATST